MELAKLKKRTVFPCKIGRTIHEPEQRVKDAFLPEDLVSPLAFRTSDSVKLEKMLHCVFEYADKRIRNIRRKEWFLTNPDEIKSVYRSLIRLSESIHDKRRYRVRRPAG